MSEARRPHVLAAGRVRSKERKTIGKKKPTRNPAALQRHDQNHGNTATATDSRRLATMRVPRDSPSSLASRSLRGCGNRPHVQLSQSVGPPYCLLHIHGRQADRHTGRLYPKWKPLRTPGFIEALFPPLQAKSSLNISPSERKKWTHVLGGDNLLGIGVECCAVP